MVTFVNMQNNISAVTTWDYNIKQAHSCIMHKKKNTLTITSTLWTIKKVAVHL